MSARGYIRTVQARERMRASALMKFLYQCAIGKRPMTADQIRSAEIVLRKIRPDLKQLEVSGTIEHRRAEEMTSEQIATRIAEIRAELARIGDDAQGGALQLDKIH